MANPSDDKALMRMQAVSKTYGDYFAGAVNGRAGQKAEKRGCQYGLYTEEEVVESVVEILNQKSAKT